MKKEVIDILTRPFDKNLIKHRRANDGTQLVYVEINHYIGRLDEAFQHDWSYELTRREIVGEQVIVEVRLTAAGLVKTGLDGVTITRENGAAVSIADDAKRAEAGALRRACRLFGIGEHLYVVAAEDDGGISSPPSRNDNGQTASNTHTLPFGDRAHAPRERLTSAQLSAVRAITKKQGLDPSAFRQSIKTKYGVELEYLTKRQASEVISTLDSNRANNGNGSHHAWAG